MFFRFLRSIPLFTAILIICYSYYCFIFLYCDRSLDEQDPFKFFCCHLLLFMFVLSYYKTTTTLPPRIPTEFYISEATMMKILNAEEDKEKINAILYEQSKRLPIYTYTTGGYIRFCPECALIKPDRTHHCSVCGQCILKMDHHCPWLHNCMSFSNYKFYILFLAYGALYCAFILVVLSQELYKYWLQRKSLNEALLYHYTVLTISAILFIIILSALFFYHIYLVFNNRTTLESFRPTLFSYGPNRNGFSLGASQNFREVFGDQMWKWFVPVFSSLGNGWNFEFPLKNKIENARIEVMRLEFEDFVPTDHSETE